MEKPKQLFAHLAFPKVYWQWHLMNHPDDDSQIVVFCNQSQNNLTPIWECSPQALKKGIYPGMALAKAQKQQPYLKVIESPKLPACHLSELSKLGQAFSPLFQVGHSSLRLNLSGTQKLYDSNSKVWTERFCLLLKTLKLPKLWSLSLASTESMASISNYHQLRYIHQNRILKFFHYSPVQCEFYLSNLPIHRLTKLNRKEKKILADLNITTLGECQKFNLDQLQAYFSNKGTLIWHHCRGLDFELKNSSLSIPQTTSKPTSFIQVSHRFTQDENSIEILSNKITYLVDKLGHQLREQSNFCKKIRLNIIYPDKQNKSSTQTLNLATQSYLEIKATCHQLFKKCYTRRIAIRSLEIRASQLQKGEIQTDLFWGQEELKNLAIQKSLDKIRQKHGFDLVIPAQVFS